MLCVANYLYIYSNCNLVTHKAEFLNYSGPSTSYEIHPSNNKLFQGILLFISAYKLKTCATRRRVARG